MSGLSLNVYNTSSNVSRCPVGSRTDLGALSQSSITTVSQPILRQVSHPNFLSHEISLGDRHQVGKGRHLNDGTNDCLLKVLRNSEEDGIGRQTEFQLDDSGDRDPITQALREQTGPFKSVRSNFILSKPALLSSNRAISRPLDAVSDAKDKLDQAQERYDELHEAYKEELRDFRHGVGKIVDDAFALKPGEAVNAAIDLIEDGRITELTRHKIEEDKAARELSKAELEYWQARIESQNNESSGSEHRTENIDSTDRDFPE